MISEQARVLIVEGDIDMAESLADLLRQHRYRVLVCAEGRQAVVQAAVWRPAAAIIEIGLPGITGYSVAQYIRGLPFGRDVLLIALTRYSDLSDIEMARYAGFHWHLAKPAQPSVIVDVLKDPSRLQKRRHDVVALQRTQRIGTNKTGRLTEG